MFTTPKPEKRKPSSQSMENPTPSINANGIPNQPMSLVAQPMSTRITKVPSEHEARLKTLNKLQQAKNVYDKHAYSYYLKLLSISKILIQSESHREKSRINAKETVWLLEQIVEFEQCFMSVLSVNAFIMNKHNLETVIAKIKDTKLTTNLIKNAMAHVQRAKVYRNTKNASILATINEENDDEEVKPVSCSQHSPLCIKLMKNAAKREIDLFFSQQLKTLPPDDRVNPLEIQKETQHPPKRKCNTHQT